MKKVDYKWKDKNDRFVKNNCDDDDNDDDDDGSWLRWAEGKVLLR